MEFGKIEEEAALSTHTSQTHSPTTSVSYTQSVQGKGRKENSSPCKTFTATREEIGEGVGKNLPKEMRKRRG